MTVTDVLALYAAALATALAAWDIAKYVLERPRLRVTCYVAQIVTPGVGRSGGDLLAYTIANIGGMPAVVSTVGGAYRSGTYFMLVSESVRLPHTLQPGESLTVPGPMPKDIEQVKCFVVHDGLNKQWKASTAVVKKQLARRIEK